MLLRYFRSPRAKKGVGVAFEQLEAKEVLVAESFCTMVYCR